MNPGAQTADRTGSDGWGGRKSGVQYRIKPESQDSGVLLESVNAKPAHVVVVVVMSF